MQVTEKTIERAKKFYFFHEEMDKIYKDFKENIVEKLGEEKFNEVMAYIIEVKGVPRKARTLLEMEIKTKVETLEDRIPYDKLDEKDLQSIQAFNEKYNEMEKLYEVEHEFFYSEVIPFLIKNKESEAFSEIYRRMPTTNEKYQLYKKHKDLLTK